MKNRRAGALGILPLYIWTLAFVLMPIIYVFVVSFSTKRQPIGVDYVFTLSNFERIFQPIYLKIIGLSVRVALVSTVGTLLIAYPFAYIMAKQPAKRRTLLMLLVVVPFWTNALMRTYGWIIMLRTKGLINESLIAFNLIETPLKLLYTDGAVMFGMAYSLLPFMILPIYSSIEKLDWSLVEASRDLGGSKLHAFLTVTLPMTLPGIFSGCVLVFVPSVGLYFISDLFGGGKSILLGNLIHNQLTGARDWPFGAALSMTMIGMTFASLIVYRKVTGGNVEVF